MARALKSLSRDLGDLVSSVIPAVDYTLDGFARGLKTRFGDIYKSDGINFTLVVSDDPADADSIVSTLTMAYFLQNHPAEEGKGAIPLLMVKRDDMALRAETVNLLEMCGVNVKDLIFMDDTGVDVLLKKATDITLVDHSKAHGPVTRYDDKIRGIVDHKIDSEAHMWVSGEDRDIAFSEYGSGGAMAASCCSVVARKFFKTEKGKHLLSCNEGAGARALLAVIVFDSQNLEKRVAREMDTDAVKELVTMVPQSWKATEPIFDMMKAAKYDSDFWKKLPVSQCLRYDYKEVTDNGRTCGLSTVLCPLEDLAKKQGFEEAVKARCANVQFFGILTAYQEGKELRRQVAYFSEKTGFTDKVSSFSKTWDAGALELEDLELEGPLSMRAFDQKNTRIDEKQVQNCAGDLLIKISPLSCCSGPCPRRYRG